MPSVRTLYARDEWNVGLLWDAGSLLALLNGGILVQVVSGNGPPEVWSVPLFLVGAAVTFGALVAADALFCEALPTNAGSNAVRVAVPAAIVLSYFGAAFGTSTVVAVDSTAGQFLLLGIANAAAMLAVATVVRYIS